MVDSLATLMLGITPWTAVMAVGVCFAAALMGGISGFGAGVIVTLFLTPIVGAKAVIPMASAMMLMTNASRVWLLRSSLDLRMALTIASLAVPASALGAWLFVRLESNVVQVLLGAVLLLSIPARRWFDRRKLKPGTAGMVAIGGVYGFLSSIITGAGMLLVPLLMGSGLAGTTLLATDAAISGLVSLTKVVFFSGLDALTLPMLLVALAMGTAMIPGTWVAAWIVRHTDIRIHTLFMEVVIVAGGTVMIWDALA